MQSQRRQYTKLGHTREDRLREKQLINNTDASNKVEDTLEQQLN